MQEVPTARWTVTQPWRGLFGLAVCIGICLFITSAYDLPGYLGLFTLWAISVVPIQVVMGIAWGGKYPPVEKLEQPWRGIALTVFMFLIASASTWWLLKFVGGGSANPVVNVYIICTVLTTMFLVIAFGCWPFHRMSVPAKGFVTLLASYLVMLALFRIWDFDALAAAIPALASVSPSGPIYWESALCFYILMFVCLWAFVIMDMWPLTKVPALTRQPVMGILIVVICFVVAFISFAIGKWVIGVQPLRLMLDFILYVFGILTVLLIFQAWPGRRWAQPVKGLVNLLVSLVICFGAFYFYRYFAGIHFGAEAMTAYPEYCMVLANMCLALTFPAYVVYSVFLDFWPLPPTPGTESRG